MWIFHGQNSVSFACEGPFQPLLRQQDLLLYMLYIRAGRTAKKNSVSLGAKRFKLKVCSLAQWVVDLSVTYSWLLSNVTKHWRFRFVFIRWILWAGCEYGQPAGELEHSRRSVTWLNSDSHGTPKGWTIRKSPRISGVSKLMNYIEIKML